MVDEPERLWNGAEAGSEWNIDGRVEDDFRERLAPVERELEAARGLVDLLVPKLIRRHVMGVYVFLTYFGQLLKQDDTTHEQAEAEWGRLCKAEEKLLQRLREDLGIFDDDPPSGENGAAPADKIVT